MVEDNPKMNELEELIDFCRVDSKSEVYIYDHKFIR